MAAVVVRLQPNQPMGITFEWVKGKLVVKAFVQPDGGKVQAQGVTTSMHLYSINGSVVVGWAFPELVSAMKAVAARERTVVFSPLGGVQAPTAPRRAPVAKAKSSGGNAHMDPSSTPSRRRRVYLEAAQSAFAAYRKEAVHRAVLHIARTQAVLRIQPVVRQWLALRLIRVVRRARDNAAALRVQGVVRRWTASLRVRRRREVLEQQRRHLAAVRAQTCARGWLALREVRRRRRQYNAELTAQRHRAAVALQCMWRLQLARVKLKALCALKGHRLRSSIAVQRLVRGCAARKSFAVFRNRWRAAVALQQGVRKQAAFNRVQRLRASCFLKKVLLRKMVAMRIARQAALLIEQRELAQRAAAAAAALATSAAAASVIAPSGPEEPEEIVVCVPERIVEPVVCAQCSDDGEVHGEDLNALCEHCGRPLLERDVSVEESVFPSPPRLSEADASVIIQAQVRRRRCLGHARKRLAAVLTIEGSWRHVLRLHASRDVAAKREAAVLCLQMAFRSVLAKRVVQTRRLKLFEAVRAKAALLLPSRHRHDELFVSFSKEAKPMKEEVAAPPASPLTSFWQEAGHLVRCSNPPPGVETSKGNSFYLGHHDLAPIGPF